MPPKPAVKLKDRPLDELIGMHETIVERIDTEIQSLEERLNQLRAYKARLSGTTIPASNQKGGKVPIKFRNPANPAETWAGRGVQPKWLLRELKTGKKLADFKVE